MPSFAPEIALSFSSVVKDGFHIHSDSSPEPSTDYSLECSDFAYLRTASSKQLSDSAQDCSFATAVTRMEAAPSIRSFLVE